MGAGTVKLHRVIRSTPEKIYKAFLNPDALSKWMPPYGFTCKVDHLDAKVGGTYKMSFTNFTTGNGNSFGGKYIQLIPNKYIESTDVFENPAMPGTIINKISLNAVSIGTELTIVQEGIPDIIPVEFCYLGWQESLDQLVKLAEPNIPD